MRVAITGADGFVGRHLRAHLEARGDAVLALAGPAPGHSGVDVCDARALREALAPFSPDALVNLAGVSSVARSHAEPVETYRVNRARRRERVRGAPRGRAARAAARRRFRQIYGPVAIGARATESSPVAPTSPYAAAKAGAEIAALSFHRAYAMRRRVRAAVQPSRSRAAPVVRGAVVRAAARGRPRARRQGGALGREPRRHPRLLPRGRRRRRVRRAPRSRRRRRDVQRRERRRPHDPRRARGDDCGVGVEARVEVDPARVRPVDIASLVGDAEKLRALGWTPRRTVREALADALDEARAAVAK